MTSERRHPPLAIALHWLTAILVIGAYVSMKMKGLFPRGSDGRHMMALWHYSLGVSVFVLAMVRLVLHTQGIRVRAAADLSRLARLGHRLLYAFMLLLPLAGLSVVFSKGISFSLYGIDMPVWVQSPLPYSKLLKEVHEVIAVCGYLLIGAHAGAALYHHHVLRDDTLKLMRPRLQ